MVKMKEVVVDTHALIWFLEDHPRLPGKAKLVLADEQSKLLIPVIVLCELLYYLKKQGRQAIFPEIFQQLEKDSRVLLLPLTPQHTLQMRVDLEMHDAIIFLYLGIYDRAFLMSKDSMFINIAKGRLIWN